MVLGLVVIHGDCVEVMAGMEPASVDAVVTDPPYGLEFMGKGWDRLIDKRDSRNGLQNRQSTQPYVAAISYQAGANAQAWHLTWATEALRVLKPGGYLLAFGGTRTFHRLACAIEDAGFEIRDCLMFLYGSGFPKSRNLDGAWQGWGTALKPGWEPIIMARKPLIGTVAANVLKHGTGSLNIDASRIEGVTPAFDQLGRDSYGIYGAGLQGSKRTGAQSTAGRWPANVVLDEEAAAMLDEQSGERTTGTIRAGVVRKNRGGFNGPMPVVMSDHSGDTGGASRFFYTAKADSEERSRGLGQRNTHPTVKPLSLMSWLVRMVTPPGGVVLDPFLGSGTTALAAIGCGFEWIGIEQSAEYVEIAKQRIGLFAA